MVYNTLDFDLKEDYKGIRLRLKNSSNWKDRCWNSFLHGYSELYSGCKYPLLKFHVPSMTTRAFPLEVGG